MGRSRGSLTARGGARRRSGTALYDDRGRPLQRRRIRRSVRGRTRAEVIRKLAALRAPGKGQRGAAGRTVDGGVVVRSGALAPLAGLSLKGWRLPSRSAFEYGWLRGFRRQRRDLPMTLVDDLTWKVWLLWNVKRSWSPSRVGTSLAG
jgi:hypothetical protein